MVLPPPSLRALLAGGVDYAGLFPPAGLALGPALDNFAAYQQSADAWLLGRFVLPTNRFREAGPLLKTRFDAARPLAVAALGPRSDSGAEFLEHLRTSLADIAGFRALHRARASVEQLEAPLPPNLAAPALRGLLREAGQLLRGLAPTPLAAFWEIPPAVAGSAATLSVIAEAQAQAPMGVKLRTGGLAASAFPAAAELAAALAAARDAGVALKFTAGLHHPVRRFDPGVGTTTHGFFNVLGAGVLAREHRLDAAGAQAILEDGNAGNFRFSEEDFTWRGDKVSAGRTVEHRAFVTSFGCCSFDEPREDLRGLGLL